MLRVLLLASLLFSSTIMAQVKNLGGPVSWKLKSEVTSVDPINLPSFDLEKYVKEDSINDVNKDTPWRFGHKHQVNYSLNNSGEWNDVYNGRIWRIRFRSKDAITMNFIFENMYIPEGGSIHIYNADKSSYIGAYTSVNNSPSKILGTDVLSGEDVIVEFFEPSYSKGLGTLKIKEVVHGYRSISVHEKNVMKALNDSGDCNRDVRCLTDTEPLWVNESNSVAMIVVNGNGSCTGTLVNNTAEDGTPYFLTANHCLGDPATWAYRFKWISPDPSCATSANSTTTADEEAYQTMNGSVLRATNADSDFALVEISNLDLATAAAWGLFYAGWDRSGDPVSAAIGIHHPSGDIMKYARENQALVKEVWQGADCWRVSNWDEGVTEPGSSGSALFDYNHRIIGQLYGGGAACNGTDDNNQPDWYGRMDASWDGASASERLKDWLDPSGNGTTSIDGFDPNQPTVTTDASIQGITAPSGFICQTDEFVPMFTLRNAGTDDLTSVTIEYSLDGGAVSTFDWTGSLASNETEVITLTTMTATDGAHTFEASTVNPNGVADENGTNDEATSNFTIQSSGVNVDFNLELDCWGDEVSWELAEDGGAVLYTGGTYSESIPNGAGTITEEWCLVEEDCYTFTINDSFDDGMSGSQYGSCNVDGYYSISQNGTILAEIIAANSDYGSQEVNSFCVLSPIQPNFTASSEDICIGEDVTFTDASSSVTSWDWDFGLDATPATATGIGPHTVSYTSAGTKTITLTSNEGKTHSMEITVNPLPSVPTITADGPTVFCENESVNLTSSDATSYEWSNGETTASINVTNSGSYSVTVTDENGCSANSADETISVETNPVLAIGTVNEPTTCGSATGSVEITGSGTGNISWSGASDGSDNGVTLPYTISGLVAGAYSVTLTSATGCISNTVNHSISDPNAPAAPVLNADGPTTFCDGEDVLLTSSEATGNTWSTGETTQSIIVSTNGSYTVTITDGSGCSSTSDEVTVTVNDSPDLPTVSAGGALEFCEGESVELTSSSATDNTWSTGETTQSITVDTDGIYQVTVENEFGCSESSDNIDVTVNNLPMVTLDPFGNSCNTDDLITLTGGLPQGGTYSGTDVNAGVFDPSAAGVGSHSITYTFEDVNGCSNSDSETIVIDDCVNLKEQNDQVIFNVYPNPASTNLFIEGADSNIESVVIYDATGRTVKTSSNGLNSSKIVLDVTSLSNGVYTISIYGDNKSQHSRVVVNK